AIVLRATDASSVLKIRVLKAGGDGLLRIGEIVGEGALRVLDARNCDLTGAGIDLPGEFPGLRSSITLHTIGDNTTIKLGSVLQKLAATTISASAIEAPTIGSVIAKAGIVNSTIT